MAPREIPSPGAGPGSAGQRAYAAYVAAVEGRPVSAAITAAMWQRLLPREQRVWEETAAAVLAELEGGCGEKKSRSV